MELKTALRLEWFATELEFMTDRGRYTVVRIGDGWEAKFWRRTMDVHERPVAIDAMDERGDPLDWPTAGTAKLACEQHHARMKTLGESADVAAARIQRLCDQHEMRESA